MLKIQEFMRQYDNWEVLLTSAPYNLIVKRKGNLILLKYNQIASDFHEPIVREARGLIVEDETYNLVCLPFFKFFNVDEKYADKIDWKTAVATEKIDGSIIKVYYYDGEWRVATNGNIDAKDAILNNDIYKNFYELFIAVAQSSKLNFSKLDKNYTYVFELVSPYNTVVIKYPKPALYHLMSRNMQTLEEENVDIGIIKPKTYLLSCEKEYRELVESLNKSDIIHEGIVVKDANNKRVKIKTQTYFEMHRVANNGHISKEYLFNLIHNNDCEEFLAYFPEYTNKITQMKIQYDKMINFFNTTYINVMLTKGQLNHFSEKVAKKQFALSVADNPYKSFFFDAWRGIDWTKKIMNIKEGRELTKILNTFFN